ncbi:very-short-patch-repair endonuclease [Dyella sp. SG562]|uniref:endonuclease domain-containing protein n=1 Tax=Dyella sp. SG562 TaxID=2587017 RepID=UPI0014224C37|nr:endonuclease domain-containing protein [Dyella sp. SG562]NII74171.1 very-short-patch-repair endonuclease [Dyella sp. SG562]
MKRLNIDRARNLRQKQTDAERALWRQLRARHLQGWKFRRQHQVGSYIVDFVCMDAWQIVELDGGQHADQVIYDERRTLELQAMGYRVLRFWNNDVLANPESVLEVLWEALASPGPSPQPSPRRGEGAGRGKP